jgi:signal transduction histidine kinase
LGDSHHIAQVLLNLLANAVKFTERGTVALTASIADKDSRLARIELKSEIQVLAFLRLNRQKSLNRLPRRITRLPAVYGGTGLGTTIARQLVGLMGGQIGVKASLAKAVAFGSNFLWNFQNRLEPILLRT